MANDFMNDIDNSVAKGTLKLGKGNINLIFTRSTRSKDNTHPRTDLIKINNEYIGAGQAAVTYSYLKEMECLSEDGMSTAILTSSKERGNFIVETAKIELLISTKHLNMLIVSATPRLSQFEG